MWKDLLGVKKETFVRGKTLKDLFERVQPELQENISYGKLIQAINGFINPSPELLQAIRKVWAKWDEEQNNCRG